MCIHVCACTCVFMHVKAREQPRVPLVWCHSPLPFFEIASKVPEKHCLSTKCPLCCMQLVNGDEDFGVGNSKTLGGSRICDG